MEWTSKTVRILPHLKPKVAKGFGLFSGAKFRAWTSLRDGRKGTTSIRRGLKTNRLHDLESIAHRALFLLIERRADIVDIRERFPILRLDETVELCAKMGVQHPNADGAPDPIVFDFLVTRRVDDELLYVAMMIIDEDDLKAGLPVSLLDVQRVWCQRNGIDWLAVTRRHLTEVVVEALDFLRGWVRHRYDPNEKEVDRVLAHFTKAHRPSETLRDVVSECARRARIDYERCENVIRYAGWIKTIPVDPFSKISLDRPLILLSDG